MNTQQASLERRAQPLPAGVENQILKAIAAIQHGTVVISIQDGRVLQIDSTEKQRISQRAHT